MRFNSRQSLLCFLTTLAITIFKKKLLILNPKLHMENILLLLTSTLFYYPFSLIFSKLKTKILTVPIKEKQFLF